MNKLSKVLITNNVPGDHLAPLHGLAGIIKGPKNAWALSSREEVMALAPELNGIINQHELAVDRELLAAAPKLKVIANVAIGYNNFDIDALNEFKVWGTNCPGVFSESAADHTLGLLLAVARRICEMDSYVRSGRWEVDGFQPGRWDGVLLAGKTMGIVGFGQIGRAVASRAEGFGMRVRFYDPMVKDDERRCDLNTLLEQSDIVSLHVPLSPATHHLINRLSLRKMKTGSILLNLARGPVVDENALADALAEGHLIGAGMDVAEREPQLHPALLAHPRVVFSPHVGGGTLESRKQARLVCAANVAAALRGQHPPNAVNEF